MDASSGRVFGMSAGFVSLSPRGAGGSGSEKLCCSHSSSGDFDLKIRIRRSWWVCGSDLSMADTEKHFFRSLFPPCSSLSVTVN